jgi:hypothetical protein
VRKPVWLLAGLLLLVGIMAVWLRPEVPRSTTVNEQPPAPRSIDSPSTAFAAPPHGIAAPAIVASASAAPAPAIAEETKPLFIEGLEATLRADEDGNLILDEQALSALETLSSMSARERELRRERLVQQLPAAASSQALDLLQRVTDYRTALQQVFPASAAPTTIPEALTLLENLRRMRADYFGEETAQRLFERQEKMLRGFIQAAGKPASAESSPEEQARRTESLLRSLFGMFIMPRKPARAIGQQDP